MSLLYYAKHIQNSVEIIICSTKLLKAQYTIIFFAEYSFNILRYKFASSIFSLLINLQVIPIPGVYQSIFNLKI